jgi:Bacterial extracellular solute-binding protein
MAVTVGVIALVGAAVAVTVHQLGHRSSSQTGAGRLAGVSSAAACTRQVHVVTASAFVPVLNEVSGSLASGSNCLVIKTTVADGQGAANVVASSPVADVWISDDASWRNLPNDAKLSGTAGSVIATSPMYFVTVKNAPLPAAASSWIGLATVLSQQTGTRLVIRDPAASADGLVAAGSIGDAVFTLSGPLESALDLMRAWQKGRMVTGTAPAFPQTSNEVAVVPEYALLRSGRADEYNVTPPLTQPG